MRFKIVIAALLAVAVVTDVGVTLSTRRAEAVEGKVPAVDPGAPLAQLQARGKELQGRGARPASGSRPVPHATRPSGSRISGHSGRRRRRCTSFSSIRPPNGPDESRCYGRAPPSGLRPAGGFPRLRLDTLRRGNLICRLGG